MARQPLSARLIQPQDMQRWEEARAHAPRRSFFSSRLWLESIPRSWGAQRRIGLFRGEEMAAGAAFIERVSMGQRIWAPHPMIPYSALWIAEPQDASASRRETIGAAAAEGLDRFLKGKARETALRLDPAFRDVRAFSRRGWAVRVQYTYTTPIGPGADFEREFENDARRQIDKAREASIRCVESEDWGAFGRAAQSTFERKGLAGSSLAEFVESLGPALRAARQGTLLSAVSQSGQPLASALIVWEAGRAAYLFGASAPEARGSGAPSLLQTEILNYLQRRGDIQTYDWHGANAPAVARFKKNFNPVLESFFEIRKSYGLGIGLARAARDAMRRWKAGRKGGES